MGWNRSAFPSRGNGDLIQAYRFTPRLPPRSIVLALHGAGNDALFAWVGFFKRLLLGGTEIFTFDLPGHGRVSQTVFEPTAAAAAIESALEQATDPHPLIPVHAVGVSLGGALLLSTLPALQARLASATLVVAPLRIVLSPISLLNELRFRNFISLWREKEHYGLLGLVPSFGPFRRDIYPLRLPAPLPPGAFGYVEALNLALDGLGLERAAAATMLPVLLAYGVEDRIVPIEQGEALASQLAGAELIKVRGGTHLSTPLEPQVVDRLCDWIDAWT